MGSWNKGKIVFFFPSYGSNEACPPLAPIAIAAGLLREGYSVTIIDSALESDPVEAVLKEVDGALCLGMSLITGPMIRGSGSRGKGRQASISRGSYRPGRVASFDST